MSGYRTYALQETEDSRRPVTQEEIIVIRNSIKIGDKIKKKVAPHGACSGRVGEKERLCTCHVIEKCRHGVLVSRRLAKDIYVRDFITYANIALERRKRK